MVIDMKNADTMIEVINSAGIAACSSDVIDLCRLLIDTNMNKKTRWMRISEFLKTMKTDGENARRPILAYLEKVMLGKNIEDAENIARIMANFSDNYFNTGKPGLSLSCYLSCMEE